VVVILYNRYWLTMMWWRVYLADNLSRHLIFTFREDSMLSSTEAVISFSPMRGTCHGNATYFWLWYILFDYDGKSLDLFHMQMNDSHYVPRLTFRSIMSQQLVLKMWCTCATIVGSKLDSVAVCSVDCPVFCIAHRTVCRVF